VQNLDSRALLEADLAQVLLVRQQQRVEAHLPRAKQPYSEQFYSHAHAVQSTKPVPLPCSMLSARKGSAHLVLAQLRLQQQQPELLQEGPQRLVAVGVGFGRIVALYHRSPSLYQIYQEM
jgi:hypothetical protein